MDIWQIIDSILFRQMLLSIRQSSAIKASTIKRSLFDVSRELGIKIDTLDEKRNLSVKYRQKKRAIINQTEYW